MGQDAEVTIWYGIETKSDEDLPETLEDIALKIDESFNGDYLFEGIAFQFFYCAEEKCGFGVEVLHHDWDFGVKRLNLQQLQNEIALISPIAIKAFAEWGLQAPTLLLQTDYS